MQKSEIAASSKAVILELKGGKVHQAMGSYAGPANVKLGHSAMEALKWRYTGAALQVGLQFMVGVLLARLLSPEAFGLVGMALIVMGFGKLIGDVGFGVAIIQIPHLTQKHVRAAFTGSAIMGMLLFAVLWFLAPTISDVFMQDTLTPILRIIGLSFMLSGMSMTLVCLLRRELRFRTLAVIETASYAVGFGIVGISMAISGYGAWSLVVAYIVQPLCLLILALHLTKLPFWPYFHLQEYRDLIRVGSAAVLNNITNHIAENMDFFVIGRWLGASTLGLYNRSFYLTTLPVSQFSAGLSSVMFPLYSKIQGDMPHLRRAYLQTVSLTSVVTMPVLFAMAAAPGVVIGGLFGPQWKEAAGALQILCLSGSLWAILYTSAALSHARGYVFSEWWRQVIYFVVMGLAIWSFIPLGMQGVALAVFFATFTRYLLLAQLSVKLTGLSWSEFFFAQIPGCLLGVIVSVTVYLISNLGGMFKIPDVLHLCIITAVSILSLIVSFFLLPSSWFGDLYPRLNEQYGINFPHWLRRIMVAKLRTSELTEGCA
jgi:PST family polysaccharide transporter